MAEDQVRSRPKGTTRPSTAPRSNSTPSQGDTQVGLGPQAQEGPTARYSLRAPPPESVRIASGRERILAQRMQVAAGMFWIWLVVATLVAAMALPLGDDANTMAALNEASAFAAGYDRSSLERSLHAHATALAGISLQKVTQRISGRGVPRVTAATEGAAPIAPHGKLELATLAQVEGLTAPGATSSIDVAAPDSLAQALAWRLARLATTGNERYTLQRIELGEGRCSAADLSREQQIGSLRLNVMQARANAAAAEQKQLSAEKVYELRRKWKSPWKAIAQANEKRVETKAALGEAQQKLMEAGASYDASAEQALKLPEDAAGDGSCRLALATLVEKGGAKVELRVPAKVERRSIAVPKVEGASFRAIKQAGLWPAVKDSTPSMAVAQLRGRFSWHNRYVEFAGMKLGGMTVLQLAPLLTIGMLLLLVRSCRRVSATYNPFDPPVVGNLPRVGLGARAANGALLLGLPLLGCALCAWSLLRIDQLPVVPVVCALASAGLGVFTFLALRRLLDLREAIMQSHSDRPPAAR